MKATRAWMLVLWLSAGGCDPDNACDPGYMPDHGLCLPVSGAPKPDSGAEDDAGPSRDPKGDDSDFGRSCAVQEDCGGKAPLCGAPQLPLCTAANCLQGESECPADWTCIDVTSYGLQYPEVLSVCVKL